MPSTKTEVSVASHLSLLLVQVIFASLPVAGKLALEGFDRLAIAAWRVLVGAAFLILAARLLHPDRWWLSARETVWALVLSILGVTINQVFFIEGLSRSTAVNVGLIIAIIPICTYAFALLLGQETFSYSRGLGMFLALAGTGQLFIFRGAEISPEHLLGNLLILVTAISYSLYLVLARPLLTRRPPLVVVAWIFVLAVPVVPLIAWGRPWYPPDAILKAKLSLLWILLFPTILAYFLNSWVLSRVSASVTAVYIYLQPVLSSVAAVIILRESFGPRELLCAVLVFAGIHLVSRRLIDSPRANQVHT